MKQSLRDLQGVVDQQLAILCELEETLSGQRDRLVERDTPGILDSIQKQGEVLLRAETIDRARRHTMDEIARPLGLARGITLGALIEALPAGEVEALRRVYVDIHATLERIRRLNKVNQRLIRRALRGIETAMQALPGPQSRSTYESSGKVRPPSMARTLIDQTT